MGRFIVKCDPEVDLYFEYSTIVGTVLCISNRAEMLAHIDDDAADGQVNPHNSPQRRMERADATGSSAIAPKVCGWDDPEGLIFDNRWFLHRPQFLPFFQGLMEGEGDEVDDQLYEDLLRELADDLRGT